MIGTGGRAIPQDEYNKHNNNNNHNNTNNDNTNNDNHNSTNNNTNDDNNNGTVPQDELGLLDGLLAALHRGVEELPACGVA